METQTNRKEILEERDKKRKRKKYLITGILIGVIILYLGFQYFKMNQENIKLKLEQNNTVCKDPNELEERTKGFISGFIEAEKYSLFVKFLIALGALYLFQIGLSGAMDLIEVLALFYVSGVKIKKKFKKKEGDKNEIVKS